MNTYDDTTFDTTGMKSFKNEDGYNMYMKKKKKTEVTFYIPEKTVEDYFTKASGVKTTGDVNDICVELMEWSLGTFDLPMEDGVDYKCIVVFPEGTTEDLLVYLVDDVFNI